MLLTSGFVNDLVFTDSGHIAYNSFTAVSFTA